MLIAERTRRGKLRRAREGRVVPTGAVPLGFSYTGDTYVVDPQTMSTVRRIFELAAAGNSMYRVRQIINSEGIGAPRGGKFWSPNTLRRIVAHDIYLPRDYTEVAELVDTRKLHKPLDPDKRYGVVWYSHIAIPVAESGLHRETVEAARRNLKRQNRAPRADNRFWELHGHAFCSCGAMLIARVARAKGKPYAYYVCSHHARDGEERCPDGKWLNAANLEHDVYHTLHNISPQDLEAQIQRLIDKERAPESEIQAAHEVIENASEERDRLVRLYTTGKIDDTRYDAFAAELQAREDTARGELDRLHKSGERIERLRLMKRIPILRVMGQTKEMRRDYYKDLELRVTADKNDMVIRGVFGVVHPKGHGVSQKSQAIQMNGTAKA